MGGKAKDEKKLSILRLGWIFLVTFLISVVLILIWAGIRLNDYGFKHFFKEYGICLLLITLIEIVIFWVGIINVYLTSVQLGIKIRAIGIICGMIPVLNIIVLLVIINITGKEIRFEKKKNKINKKRHAQQICKTKYPILLVHGVFFRDSKHFNYWGRIPKELESNGAKIFYGNHQSASSVKDSAKELAQRIKQIVEENNCEKVNVIAHSKGGLDIKTAITTTDVAPYVASLTTVNTPHRGCEFADYLLNKAPKGLKEKVATVYNKTLKKLGDENPDFIAAVTDLTAEGCKNISALSDEFDFKKAGIYTQSIGSVIKKATGGQFPLNFSYYLVKYFDGENDGLVGEKSFEWGDNYIFVKNDKKRGISHGDMIDLNRQNIEGFDVREFYVELVNKLKIKGL